MKRLNLLKWLYKNGAWFVREGSRHTIIGKGKLRTEVPRHKEIIDPLASKICKDLEIKDWRKR